MLVKAGIPVVGHIGFTPQTVTALGGYKVQGKDIRTAQYLLDSAAVLEQVRSMKDLRTFAYYDEQVYKVENDSKLLVNRLSAPASFDLRFEM